MPVVNTTKGNEMIYDKEGKPIEDDPKPHTFGQFNLPPDARLTIKDGIKTEQPPTQSHKEWYRKSAEKR